MAVGPSPSLLAGHSARFACSDPIEVDEVAWVIDWVGEVTGQPILFSWMHPTTGKRRRTRKRSAALDAVAEDGVVSLWMEPDDDAYNPEWQASVHPTTNVGTGAPGITWSWLVLAPSGPPVMPPNRDREEWLEHMRRLAVRLSVRVGYIGGHTPGTARLFAKNVEIFRVDALDKLSGYQWLTVVDDALYEVLMEHRERDEFPWFEATTHPTASGGLHWLRATREPGEMTPELWSRLRWFFEPLLPAQVELQPRHLIFGWDCYAPQDVFDPPAT